MRAGISGAPCLEDVGRDTRRLLRKLSGGGAENPARRAALAGFYWPAMKGAAAVLLALAAGVSPVRAGLTDAQMADAERSEAVTVPAPAEFFAAIDKAGKPDWAVFYRDPVPTTYATRPQAALNLGALVADAFVAVEAQDGQQVKNTGKDIIALARALGVGEDVLGRGKSISDFADKSDWFALREELEATTNEVRQAMVAQRDKALSSLITAGAWLRALQVGSRAAELSGEASCAELLRQPALVSFLRAELQLLPEKARAGSVVAEADEVLSSLAAKMAVPEGQPFGSERVLDISTKTTRIITDMSARKQP